jgi:hypothetical protein
MNSKGKYIGIENRIPFEIIENAIYDYIQTDIVNKDGYLQHIKQFTKGENRAKKILKHLSVLIDKNENVIDKFKKSLKGIDYFQLNISDRKAFILCLFCLTYPIAFDILTALATGFKVQNILNKQYVIQKIGATYGGNRAMHIATVEVMPLLIECGIIKREKIGLYSLANKITVTNTFLSELVIYTDIKSSGTKSILIDDLAHKPWYSFFDISFVNPDIFSHLISRKDSAVGKGYLTI